MLFKCRGSLLRIQSVNSIQLLRPVLKKTRGVKSPTSHVGKALPLSEIKLTLLKHLLCALALSDVLDCTVEAGGLAPLVFLYSARTIEDAHFAAGTDDAVFHVIPHTTSNDLLLFSKNTVPIFSMDPLPQCVHVHGTFLRPQSKNA